MAREIRTLKDKEIASKNEMDAMKDDIVKMKADIKDTKS